MIDDLPLAPLARLGRSSGERSHPADLYDAWLFAAADASLSLADWRGAMAEQRADAYVSYVAALDREEQAAARLELRLARA